MRYWIKFDDTTWCHYLISVLAARVCEFSMINSLRLVKDRVVIYINIIVESLVIGLTWW